MSGTKRETPPTPAGGMIGGNPDPDTVALMEKVGRGLSPTVRVDLLLKGIIQRFHMAHKNGDETWGRCEQIETAAIPAYIAQCFEGFTITRNEGSKGAGAGGRTGG